MKIFHRFSILFCFFLAGCIGPSEEDTADVIYHGGTILTMGGSHASVEAVAVQDGNILALGSKQDVLRHRGKTTQMIDLGSNTLMPGFIDSHGSFAPTVYHAAFGELLPRGIKSIKPSEMVLRAGRDEAELMKALDRVQADYAAMGYTTIRDGNSRFHDVTLFRKAAYKEKLYLDLVVYPAIQDVPLLLKQYIVPTQHGLQLQGNPQYSFDGYLGNFRMGGLSASSPDLARHKNLLQQLERHGIQVWVEADRQAVDRFIDSAQALGVGNCDYNRSRVVKTPFHTPDQVSDWFALGISTSFVSENSFAANQAKAVAAPADPLRLLAKFMAYNSENDRGNDARNRFFGFLKALTIDAAYLHHEDLIKGSIEYGKLADFVLIEGDLMARDIPAANELRILQTIKEGKVVYQNHSL